MDFDTERDPDKEEGASRDPGERPRRVSDDSSTTEFIYTDPVQSFVATVRGLITRPVNFFAGIERRGDFVNPLIFALVCVVISGVIAGFLGILGALAGLGNGDVGGAFADLLGYIIISPVVFAIVLLVCAGILHLLTILIIKPISTGFEATFRVACYSAVGQLASWIPILGSLVAFVTFVVLSIIGIREVHGTTTGKAALVVLIPSAIVFLLALILLILGAVLIFRLFQQGI